MIDVKQLRIGNWIIDAGCGKTQIRGEMMDEYLWRGENAFPIPLTPEILEACGFKYKKYKGITRLSDGFDDEPDGDTHNWTLKVPKNEQVEDLPTFKLVKFGDDEIKFSHKWLRVTVKHLHQLQNLYFSLTGKELTYSPNNTVK